MAIPNVNGFRVKKGNETGITKIATDAILDKAVTKAKLSQPVQTEINKIANKADQDGDYDSLTAGGAKQLLSTVYVDDNEPYNFRTAGGSADIGDRMYEEVVGGTVVWHQWVHPVDTTHMSFTADGTIENGVATFTATQQYQGISYTRFIYNSGSVVTGHKYLRMFDVRANEDAGSLGQLYWPAHNQTNLQVNFSSLTVGQWKTVASIVPATADYSYYQFGINDNRSSDWTSVSVRNIMAIDLTQMFGTTIADYIYSLEQGSAGAGVAWFRKLFPKPYYEYNVGELMSVKAGSHDTVGFNAWDEEWEVGAYSSADGQKITSVTDRIRSKNFIPVIPSAAYYVNKGLQIYFYDKDKKFIDWQGSGGPWTITMEKSGRDVHYVTFNGLANSGTTYNNDICINLAWDGERNGEYEPYEKHTYPLAELELRGIPKLDANNQLYYDGDTYASDGTVTRKYGVYTLQYQTAWKKSSSYPGGYYISGWVNGNSIPESPNHIQNSGFVTASTLQEYVNTTNCVFFDQSLNVKVDAEKYPTVESFIAYIQENPITMVYPLKTTTTETADTFVNPQVVDDFGTEEYVDYAVEAGDRDVAIPVGHNSQYMNNLRAKLEMSPDSPDGDGKYIVQQTNGENAYIPYTADGRLDAIEAKLPAPPSANGTYKLTATVTDGGVTYTWVAG